MFLKSAQRKSLPHLVKHSIAGALLAVTVTTTAHMTNANAASSNAGAKCDKNVIPISKIKGFTLASKECKSSGTMPRSTFVFQSKAVVSGLDLMEAFDGNVKNQGVKRAAKMFQNMNRALNAKWTWDNPELGRKKTITPKVLTTTYKDCANAVPDNCGFTSSYVNSTMVRYFTSSTTVKWVSTGCTGRGWYLCDYKLELTVFSSEAYID